MKATVVTGTFVLEFQDLNNAMRYARTSLTFEGLQKTHILWEGRKISAIRPCNGDYGVTKKSRPYGVSGEFWGSPAKTYKTLEDAVLAANDGNKVWSWREGTHRVAMLVHIA